MSTTEDMVATEIELTRLTQLIQAIPPGQRHGPEYDRLVSDYADLKLRQARLRRQVAR